MSWRDAIARAILGGRTGGPHAGGIYTYHSSPHDFEKFDWSKLRTGEGANVYGAGFYSAEHPAVSGQGGEYWRQFLDAFPGAEVHAASKLRFYNNDRAKALTAAQRDIEAWDASNVDPFIRNMNALRQKEAELLASDAFVGPRTYELNLKVQPNELLDWDRPLTAQSPQVIDALANSRSNLVRRWAADLPTYGKARGENAYDELTGIVGQPEASQHLRDLGVPGIRYLDQGSRDIVNNQRRAEQVAEHWRQQMVVNPTDETAAWLKGAEEKLAKAKLQQPTYNYVMFDPDKIDIMTKYGVAGAAPIGAATFAGSDQAQAAEPATFNDRFGAMGALAAPDQYAVSP